MKKNILFGLLAVAVCLAAGCGKNAGKQAQTIDTLAKEGNERIPSEKTEGFENKSGEDTKEQEYAGVIKVGTTGAPYTDIMDCAKVILAKEGWDLQVTVYSDYEKINQDVLNGTLDAHLFAHQTYINSYNDVNAADLISIAGICYEKYGIYSGLNEELTKFSNNVVVGIPQDTTRKACSLLFLQDLGYLTLKDGAGLIAAPEDITDNPKNIRFLEYAQDTLTDVLQTADYCVVGSDFAILAGLDPKKDVLSEMNAQTESADAIMIQLVTTEEKADDEKLHLLEKALQSEEMYKYIEDTYKGALGINIAKTHG